MLSPEAITERLKGKSNGFVLEAMVAARNARMPRFYRSLEEGIAPEEKSMRLQRSDHAAMVESVAQRIWWENWAREHISKVRRFVTGT